MYRFLGAMAMVVAVAFFMRVSEALRLAPSISTPSTGGKPPALVAADDELASYLTGARKNIKDGNYDRAIEVLQALIEKPDSGFVSDEGGRQYVALWHKANEALAAMGPEGLELYRRLYDPQAEELFQQAGGAQDTSALRRLTQQFLHTAFGYRALCMLGDIHFDRGHFARSAMYWRRAARLKAASGDAPVLLAKIASALHLAGDSVGGDSAAAELKKKHSGAEGVMGGQKRNLVEFVAMIRKIPVPSISDRRRQAGKEWSGLGSFPDGMAIMGDSDVVLAPSWRAPDDVPIGPVDVRGKMIAMRSELTSHSSSYTLTPKPRKGHVYVTSSRRSPSHRSIPGAKGAGFFMPAGVQPVVAGDLVLCRLDDGVAAYNMHTGPDAEGEPVWATRFSPMRKKGAAATPRYYSGVARQVADSGRYAMTVDGDMLYLLAKFIPRQWSRSIRGPAVTTKSNTSVLQAVSISRGGRLVWQSDYETLNSDEAVLGGKFISVPTVCNGRLYSLVAFREMYHLVCMAADTGKVIWRVSISQIPAMGQNYQRYNQHLLERGSPVAVAEGMAFVATNAGVVAAFEAESGAAVWAYQYDSDVNKAMSSRYGSVIQITGQPSVNPIIVARGRVIALPADSKRVLMLSAMDGKPVISPPDRRQCSDLSAIDADRVLLSGPDMVVLSTSTGKELHRTSGVGIVGRPAVSADAVLASGQGRLVRLDLNDYTRSTRVFTNGDCLLGNLLCVDGKLIASNSVGVCVYLCYEDSFAGLSRRIEKLKGSQKARLIFDRGQLSFNSQRFDRALTDFKSAAVLAEQGGSTAIRVQLSHWLYRTHVAMGNAAKNAGDMRKHFELARRTAESMSGDSRDQYVLRCMMRLARVMELTAGEHQAAAAEKLAAGDKPAAAKLEARRQDVLAEAVKFARKIAETHAELKVPDISIGAGADNSVRDTENTPLMLAGVWAQERFIPRIIRDHGRKCYGSFDAQAGDMLQKAIADNDTDMMLEVSTRWPNSLWAPQAMYEAGVSLYVKTRDAGDQTDYKAMSKAAGWMARAAAKGDEMLAAASLAGRATIYHDMGMTNYARGVCRDMRKLCRAKGITLNETIEFAGAERPIIEILRKCEGDKPLKVESDPDESLVGPVNRTVALKGAETIIVRDQEYRPIRKGSNILLLNDGKAVWFNTAAESDAEAVVWRSGAVLAPMDQIRNYMTAPGYGLIAGLSSDGKIVALADRGSRNASGIDVATGKVVWRESFAKLGLSSISYMACAEGVGVLTDSTGKVVCISLKDGAIGWVSKLVGGSRAPVCPPRISRRAVMVRSNAYKTLTCFNVDGGRVLWKWAGGTSADGFVTDDGLVIVMVDGVVSLHDPAMIDRPLWARKYNAALKPMLLCSDGGRLFVSEGAHSPWIDAVSMSDGITLARVKADEFSGSTNTSIVSASARGASLYVAYGSQISGNRNNYYGTQSMVKGLGVQKIDLADGKVAWRSEPGAVNYYYYSLPTIVAGGTVVVACKDTQQTLARYVHLLDAESGKSVQKVEVYKGPAGVMKQGDRVRVSSMLQPILIGGRLVLETFDSVSVYKQK